MRIFERSRFKEDAKQFVKEWAQLLSTSKLTKALDLLDQLPIEESDFSWTKENLKEAFIDYGGPGRMPEINGPILMGKDGDSFEFDKYDDGSGWAIEYDIPLDGKKGNLTAQFSIKKSSRDLYSINLEDLRVI